METISLNDLLRLHWSVLPDGRGAIDMERVESARERESALRGVLSDKIVRRLDAGFSRSCTVHPDTARALYALCRALRPECVFETGTYWGYSTAYLAAAVRDNGTGRVYTFDIYDKAGKHIPPELLPYVEMHRGRPSTESMPEVLKTVTPGLFFQDSRHDFEGVAEEIQVVAPHLQNGAAILFHDFAAPEVRRAAVETLPNYALYEIASQDPQQLGIAVKTT